MDSEHRGDLVEWKIVPFEPIGIWPPYCIEHVSCGNAFADVETNLLGEDFGFCVDCRKKVPVAIVFQLRLLVGDR